MTRLDDVIRERLDRVTVPIGDVGAARSAVVAVAARRRRRRRRLAAGATAVIAIGAITAAVAQDDPKRLDVIVPAEATTIPEGPSPGPAPTTSAPLPTVPTDSAAAPATRADGPKGAGQPTVATTEPVGRDPGASEGCVAEGYEQGVNLKPDGSPGGVGAGPQPTCTYTATRPGGYVAKGKWRIEIRRGSYEIVVTPATAPACRPVGFIQPGDVVTVTVTGGVETSGDPGYVKAGPQHAC